MMLLARKILFYFLIITYLIVCPLLILYSFGFIFNPLNNRIVRTGLVYLSTDPPDADIFLGKSHYRYKTPASITDLIPGNYRITLKLNGYRTWTHTVAIQEGKAVTLDNIVLIPNVPEIKSLLPDTYENIIPLPGTDIFLLKSGTKLGNYTVFNWKKEESSPLVTAGSPFYELPVFSVFTQPRSDMILVYGGTLWTKEYLLINTKKENSVIEATKLFPEKPEEIKWSPKNSAAIFTFRDGKINRLDTASMSLFPKYFEEIKGFGLQNSFIYTLDKENNLLRWTYDKKSSSAPFKDEGPGEEIFGKARFYEIEVTDDDVILFLSKNGNLISSLPPYNLLDTGVRGIEYNKDTRNLLYWTRNSIYIANLVRDTLPAQPQQVYAGGRNLRQSCWAYKGTHAVLLDKDEVYLLELMPDGKHHIEPIVKVKRSSSVFYSDESDYLYYLRPGGGGLAAVRIIPKKTVFAP